VNIIARVARRIVVRLGLGIARRRRLIAVAVIALAAVIAVNALNVSPPWAGRQLAVQSAGHRTASADEPLSTANYLRGQQSFDARLIWESYSDRVVQDLARRGNSLEDTQRQLDRAREVGRRIEQAQYIGGYPIPNGSMHFYLVMQTGPGSGSGRGDVTYVPYVFTLDAQGKIERVE
jgi:hypothetical protein